MERATPMLPKLILPPVDVRDMALAHLRVMKTREAVGLFYFSLRTLT